MKGVVEDLQDRVRKLEQQLNLKSEHGLFSAPDEASQAAGSDAGMDSGSIRLKGSSTRYYSSSHAVALLDQFNDVRQLMQHCMQHAETKVLANNFRVLQRELPKKFKTDQRSVNFIAMSEMRDSLPPKTVCDRLVALYIDNFESTFRILHIPSFLSSCQHFWENREEQLLTAMQFLPQLQAVLCVAAPLEDTNSLGIDSNTKRATIVRWLDLIETWLGTISKKKGLSFSALQIQCLYVLARQSCSVRQDEIWKVTGSLARSAIAIGLHRDTDGTPGISKFDTELRRRLWYSVVEFDLQASIAECAPTMILPEHFDTLPPANVNDSDLVENMEELPISKDPQDWTDSSCQVALARSLALRLTTCHELWNIRHDVMMYEEVLRLSQRLEKLVDDIPPVLKRGTASDNNEDGLEILFHRTSFDILVRRVTVLVQRHLVAQCRESPDGTAAQSFISAQERLVKSATIVLSHLDAFESEAHQSKQYRDLFWSFFKDDIFHAAITICLELKTTMRGSWSSSTAVTSLVPLKRRYEQYSSNHASPMSGIWTGRRASLIRKVEIVLRLFFDRIDELESNIKDPLVLSLVLESVRFDEARESKHNRMRDGIRRVLEAGRRKKDATSGTEGPNATNAEVLVSGVPQTVASDSSDAFTYPDGFFNSVTPITALDLDTDYALPFDVDWTFDQMWP